MSSSPQPYSPDPYSPDPYPAELYSPGPYPPAPYPSRSYSPRRYSSPPSFPGGSRREQTSTISQDRSRGLQSIEEAELRRFGDRLGGLLSLEKTNHFLRDYIPQDYPPGDHPPPDYPPPQDYPPPRDYRGYYPPTRSPPMWDREYEDLEDQEQSEQSELEPEPEPEPEPEARGNPDMDKQDFGDRNADNVECSGKKRSLDTSDENINYTCSHEDSERCLSKTSGKRFKLNIGTNSNGSIQSAVITSPIATASRSISSSPTEKEQFCLIHRVICERYNPQEFHSALHYEDPPVRSSLGRRSGHYIGEFPVYDVAQHVSNYRCNAFVITKDYRCQDHRSPIESYRTRSSENVASNCITILSPEIDRVFAQVALYSPLLPLLTKTNLKARYYDRQAPEVYIPRETEMLTSYSFIYHHRSQLKKVIDETEEETTKADLSALLEYVETEQYTSFKEADKLVEEFKTTSKDLRRLFLPNEIVVSSQNPTKSAFVLRDWPMSQKDSTFLLPCWSWAFDGFAFKRKHVNLVLEMPSQEAFEIRQLAIYPLRFAPQEVRESLVARGGKFWDLRFRHYISYSGWDFKEEELHSETRCIVDYQTYRKFHEEADAFQFNPGAKLPFDKWPDEFNPNESIEEENLILMPPNVHGFTLNEKHWVNLLVDGIEHIKWNKEAFDRLVLPSKTKDLIKALITVRTSDHASRKTNILPKKREDIISGKGNGLIMLLHGGPGTGKTLTAESVAEIAEMPLYSVTCGDIGTNADAVEKYLKTVLYLGKTWNCVLLLDEADVFLEERTLSDLERNSLVSVFLRILEYYEGILILASNRVGTFDEAFKSRIQVALHYPKLSFPSRKTIWQNFFDMLQQNSENVDFEELQRHIDELAEREMNGREIRNSITTAGDIARYKKEPLAWTHMELAINSARDFTRYLQNVHGHTEDDWAREDKRR